MLCIINKSSDPFFNIASEEYIFRNFNQDCFMLWSGNPSVVIGRHQNALAEINYDFIKKKNIKVVRRLSGGGAVYHDPGNLNFTFISTGNKGKLMNFKKFTEPVIKALHEISVRAKFEGKNNLVVDGLKISGNAEHVFGDRILHHGTLLFNTNLGDLDNALTKRENPYSGKAVTSIRSKVTNISLCINDNVSIIEFRELLRSYLFNYFPGTKIYNFSDTDINKIGKLVRDKYSRWEWNFGRSPHYAISKAIKNGKYKLTVEFAVSKGVITKFRIDESGNFGDITKKICKAATGIKHEEISLTNKLAEFRKSSFFNSISVTDFVNSLF